MILIQHEPLVAFAREILLAAGVPAGSAELVAMSLGASNLRGVDSHGVQLLPPYIDKMRSGGIDVTSQGHVDREDAGCMIYNGDNAIGQVVARNCSDHAIRLAKAHGTATVVAHDSNHFGAAAFWAQRMAAAGMIGIVTCNASPIAAPSQGKERRYGTNPICMALPGPNQWLLDMATTTVAMGKIFKAEISGESTIPAGWAMDSNGVPTTDTKAALEGSPMPLGGYKGYGLAMMAEILCAGLSGGAMSLEVGGIRIQERPMRISQFFQAIDLSRFMPVEQFSERIGRFVGMMKSSAPATGYDEVLVAGEPEWRNEADRRETGIPLSDGVWQTLTDTGASLGVEPPGVSTIVGNA